ncbi:MAG: LuxR C-terminal-related transcriptional regulator [Armatimonadota bacterium]|nr:LuxR C-terminal-related transcriptional regulator [Armatimonadota bacterium]MDR7411226.1 LuxR C-terminal-related transcriptional regulator [Armatimonadota bacterium]MDR7424898.1 LuxR C-terminal-related transcriptional regulator [Armatimonadota bacterium]MDR7441702.1 LuxR C-terminal-related transcriptional regulator [Armatimonadota bacterium]MDR7530367.1 LuxR C-terminal-related transcriptional regulator [Armatimonadota bacterium]
MLRKLGLAADSLIRDRHPEGFFLVDGRQRIVGWSSGMEEILGLATQQALGRPCFQVLRRLRLRDPLPCSRNCNPLRAAARGERSVCVLRREHTLGAWSLLHQPVATPNGPLVLHRLRDASLEVISIRFLRRVVEALRDEMDELQLAKAAAYADNVALTTREKQVLHLLARGLPTRAIAERLSISYYTARNYVQSLLSKLDAHNRVEVVVAAQRLGLLEGDAGEPAALPSGHGRTAR